MPYYTNDVKMVTVFLHVLPCFERVHGFTTHFYLLNLKPVIMDLSSNKTDFPEFQGTLSVKIVFLFEFYLH